LIRQIICTGLLDRVARKMTEETKQRLILNNPEFTGKLGGAYECTSMPGVPVFIHPSSSLFSPDMQPAWLCYHELLTTSKVFMKGE
jgi:hypothetical protein